MLIVQGSGGGFLFHVFDKRSGEPLCGFMRNGRGPGKAFAFDEREVNCFVDLFATRDRIYAPDGHALERITTDWNIRAMCVGADGTIYAALYDNLSRIFLGRIVPSEGEEALRR